MQRIMMLQHRAESNFRKPLFCYKQYVHSTSNPLLCFLLPPYVPQECQTLLNSQDQHLFLALYAHSKMAVVVVFEYTSIGFVQACPN